MQNKLIFYLILFGLTTLGVWGAAQIAQEKGELRLSVSENNGTKTEKRHEAELEKKSIRQEQRNGDNHFEDIRASLVRGSYQQAAAAIDEHHSSLSSSELEQLKQEFLNYAAAASRDKKTSILRTATEVFDELDVWKKLSSAAINSNSWQLAFNAQLRASELEYDPIELERLLNQLVRSSSYLRAAHEKNDDQLSVKLLYQTLSELHPQFSRFKLEQAYAHIKLNEFDPAYVILDSLIYDSEFGEAAKQSLLRIETKRNSDTQSASSDDDKNTKQRNPADIVVPLVSSGSSFLIDTTINQRKSRLLLDTGASITALSSDLIRRLDLAPTGQSIQLSTANGITQAKLYRASSLSLGRLTLRNMVVAEIDLGRQGLFDGLLGTDVLNQFNSNYSYLIDNREKALIFKAR